jgi:hypothetical protein
LLPLSRLVALDAVVVAVGVAAAAADDFGAEATAVEDGVDVTLVAVTFVPLPVGVGVDGDGVAACDVPLFNAIGALLVVVAIGATASLTPVVTTAVALVPSLILAVVDGSALAADGSTVSSSLTMRPMHTRDA